MNEATSEVNNKQVELDTLFPKARSKEIVEFNGERYQRRFHPRGFSNSGRTVTEWRGTWIPVEGLKVQDKKNELASIRDLSNIEWQESNEVAAPAELAIDQNLYDQEPFVSAISKTNDQIPPYPWQQKQGDMFLKAMMSNIPTVFPTLPQQVAKVPVGEDVQKLFATGGEFAPFGVIKLSPLKKGLPKDIASFIDLYTAHGQSQSQKRMIALLEALKDFPFWDEYIVATGKQFSVDGLRKPNSKIPTPSYGKWISDKMGLQSLENPESGLITWKIPASQEVFNHLAKAQQS